MARTVEGAPKKAKESHNDNNCHFFHASGTAKKSKQKPYDKKYEKKNFNHNLDDSFSAHEMKAIRKNLVGHSKRSRSSRLVQYYCQF